MGDELVDLVDEGGHVVGVATRREMRARRLRHRAVFVIVRSTRAEVLIHRRSETKDLWPGWWDLCVGGVVTAGEAWDAAAIREVREEVGVEVGIGGVELCHLGGGVFTNDEVSLVGEVYSVVHDGPFTFADGEVVEARFVPTAEIERLTGELRFLPDSVALVLPRL